MKSGVSAEDRPLPKGFDWPKRLPVAFLQTTGREPAFNKSKSNEKEVKVVVGLVENVVGAGMECKDIGVITAYSAQVKKLNTQLNVSTKLHGKASDVEVRSVDGFQVRDFL